MSAGPQVFINYRRIDSDADAQWLADTLKSEFGEDHVFVDVDDIDGGEKLGDTIDAALGSAKVLLAVIGPGWLSAADPETGTPRIRLAEDWVRREFERARQTGRNIVLGFVLEQ